MIRTDVNTARMEVRKLLSLLFNPAREHTAVDSASAVALNSFEQFLEEHRSPDREIWSELEALAATLRRIHPLISTVSAKKPVEISEAIQKEIAAQGNHPAVAEALNMIAKYHYADPDPPPPETDKAMRNALDRLLWHVQRILRNLERAS
jgi:hypothetical protein